MCSLRIERKGLKFIQKERKDLLFLGFFEGQKNALIFFFLSRREKTKSHVRIKRDWQYTFVVIIIVSAFAGAFRKREREDEDDGKGSDDESEEEEDRSERFMGFDRE